MIERHFCVHPLLPRYSTPTPEGIKTWAVKQMYGFCVLYELPNLWAYLWENWYWRGQWELWARSGNPKEVSHLKTTMLVEGQWVNQFVMANSYLQSHSWQCVMGDYLYHFSLCYDRTSFSTHRYIGLHRFLFFFCYPFTEAHVRYYLVGVLLYDTISRLSCVWWDLICLSCTISISEPPLLQYLVLGEYRSPST